MTDAAGSAHISAEAHQASSKHGHDPMGLMRISPSPKRRRDRRFEAPGDLPEAASGAPSPEDQVAAATLAAPLTACLDALAPHTRAAVLMRHQEGLSFTQMSEVFQEKAGTLQARVARALPALRACLEAAGLR